MPMALVTGGASGIGAALAETLAARGWRVAIADRATPAQAHDGFHRVDFTDPAATAALIDTVWDAHGPIDLVCSNAGMGRNKKLKREPLGQEAHDLFEANSFAAVRLAQAYLARLEQTERNGRLMITASENSLSQPAAVKDFGLGLYAASKHAVLALGEWLAWELREGPLGVHILLPGPVYSPAIAAGIPDPAAAPPGFDLISCARCADIALQGLDLGLTYIPTHAHLLQDMQPRRDAIAAAIAALNLR